VHWITTVAGVGQFSLGEEEVGEPREGTFMGRGTYTGCPEKMYPFI